MMKKVQAPTAGPRSVATDPPLRAPKLDLGTVRTRYDEPRSAQPARRHFGLPEAPVFFPTPEEFTNPLQYIEKIRAQAEPAGICKIVPPAAWRPPFALDSETFRFHTRRQQLNSLEGKTRANLNYLEQLYKFHAREGHTGMRVPQLAKRPIDLYALKNEVVQRGGYAKVTEGKKWAEVGRALNYHRDSCTSLSNSLKKAYLNVVQPYEQYLAKVKKSPGPPRTPRAGGTTPGSPAPKREEPGNAGGSSTGPASPASAAGSLTSERTETTVAAAEDGPTPRRSKRRKLADSRDATPLASPTTPGSARSKPTPSSLPNGSAAPSPKPTGKPTPSRTRMSNGVAAPTATPDDDDDPNGSNEACEVCGSAENDARILLCDGCDKGFHLDCLDPPLKTVPKSDWYCLSCILQAGGDFGFEDGEEYSLQAFQEKCNTFKREWFASYFKPKSEVKAGVSDAAPGDGQDPTDPTVKQEGVTGGPTPVSTDDNDNTSDHIEGRVPEQVAEAEFWRLVESPYEDVEVEYGADLHSMRHGSAFPTRERRPLEPYSLDPWNLNNIPILPESLFAYIKSDISGMMTPWLYVGMCFSTFCWHNEDHYTYSVNYMHWGDTKTWYGIPGTHAERFEAAIRAAVPELFEQQPDLLFQLVTMMSPGSLVKSGVDVYAVDQRPGQFVVTFPQAYHAGFNHGFNFAEAVNFALPNWIPHGLNSVRRYQQYRRLPVFSHDELLWTIAAHARNPEVAEWLWEPLVEMTTRELSDRNRLRQAGVTRTDAVAEPEAPADDEYQCSVCKTFAYLSAVGCGCGRRVACLDHALDVEFCTCPVAAHRLILRYPDQALTAATAKISTLATAAPRWIRRFRQVMLAGGNGPVGKVTDHEAKVTPDDGTGSTDPASPKNAQAAVTGPGSLSLVAAAAAAAASNKFRPSLLLLCQLLEEANRIPTVIEDARVLQLFVDRALHWVREVHQFLDVRYPADDGRGVDANDPDHQLHLSAGASPRPESGRESTSVAVAPGTLPLTPTRYYHLTVPEVAAVEVPLGADPPALPAPDDPALVARVATHAGCTQPAPVDRDLAHLEALLGQADRLAFDAPEVHLLRDLAGRAAAFHHRVQVSVDGLGQLFIYQPHPPAFNLVAAGDPAKVDDLTTALTDLTATVAAGEELPLYLPDLAELRVHARGLAWSLRAQTALTRAASALQTPEAELAAAWYASPAKLSFEEFIELLEDAVEGQIPGENTVFVALIQAKNLGDQWAEAPAQADFFARTEVTLDEVREILRGAFHLLPHEPPAFTRAQSLGRQFEALDREATAAVARTGHRDVTKRPLVAELRSLLERFDNLYTTPPAYRPDVVTELKDAQARIDTWILRGKKLFARGNMPKKWVEMLLEVEEAVKRCTDHLPSVRIAYRLGAQGAQPNDVLQRTGNGRPRPLLSSLPTPADDDDGGDTNGYHDTDNALSRGHDRRHQRADARGPPLYCVCRQPEQGFMVECDLCHEWYHGGCLKLSRRETKALSYFVCPICDPAHVEVPHPTKRPSLDTLIAHAQEGGRLPFVTLELDPLITIILDGSRYRERVTAALALRRAVPLPTLGGAKDGGKGEAHSGKPSPTPLGLLTLYQALLRCGEGMEVSLPHEEADMRKLAMHLRVLLYPADNGAREWIEQEQPREPARIRQQLEHEARQRRHVRGGGAVNSAAGATANGSPHPTTSGKSRGGSGGGSTGPTIAVGSYLLTVTQKAFDPSALYCLCQQPFAADQAMVACDTCQQWYHLDCVHVPVRDACQLDTYQCPVCAVRLRVPYAFGEIMVVDDPDQGTAAEDLDDSDDDDDDDSEFESAAVNGGHGPTHYHQYNRANPPASEPIPPHDHPASLQPAGLASMPARPGHGHHDHLSDADVLFNSSTLGGPLPNGGADSRLMAAHTGYDDEASHLLLTGAPSPPSAALGVAGDLPDAFQLSPPLHAAAPSSHIHGRYTGSAGHGDDVDDAMDLDEDHASFLQHFDAETLLPSTPPPPVLPSASLPVSELAPLDPEADDNRPLPVQQPATDLGIRRLSEGADDQGEAVTDDPPVEDDRRALHDENMPTDL